nr:hypothetical protein [Gammaproteobacteria bacterium]
MNINKALVKGYQDKPLKVLVKAPVSALTGVSEADAKNLQQAFGIKTIGDMANNKFFRWASAIAVLAEVEE